MAVMGCAVSVNVPSNTPETVVVGSTTGGGETLDVLVLPELACLPPQAASKAARTGSRERYSHAERNFFITQFLQSKYWDLIVGKMSSGMLEVHSLRASRYLLQLMVEKEKCSAAGFRRPEHITVSNLSGIRHATESLAL
jgi:hypothetical protein